MKMHPTSATLAGSKAKRRVKKLKGQSDNILQFRRWGMAEITGGGWMGIGRFKAETKDSSAKEEDETGSEELSDFLDEDTVPRKEG